MRVPHTAWLGILALLGGMPGSSSAQNPTDLIPLEIVDVGPEEAPFSCTCVSDPFVLTSFRPDPRYAGGLGVPLHPARLSKSELALQRRVFAAADREIRVELSLAEAGDANTSFGIAINMASGASVFRDEARAFRGTAAATQLEAAAEQWEAAAAHWYVRAASDGHHQAATLAAYRFARGIGVPRDDAAAAYWYRVGAMRGDPNAMTGLGLLHASGRGVPLDYGAAAYWWYKADTGVALRLLGDAYACGVGVELNPGYAVQLYQRSREHAALQLAHMYRSGCGVPLDDVEAAKWLGAEANRGNPAAQIELSEMLRLGLGVEPNEYFAYTLAALAAARLPAGTLRDRAVHMRDEAARLLSPAALAAEIEMTRDLVNSGRETP